MLLLLTCIYGNTLIVSQEILVQQTFRFLLIYWLLSLTKPIFSDIGYQWFLPFPKVKYSSFLYLPSFYYFPIGKVAWDGKDDSTLKSTDRLHLTEKSYYCWWDNEWTGTKLLAIWLFHTKEVKLTPSRSNFSTPKI